MGRLKYNTPLTAEERVFAAENAYFIDWYIRKHHLDYDEWYDVLAIAYLKSVKKWFAEHELHKYKFSTIAGRTFHYAFMKEYKIKKQKPKIISLFELIPGTDGKLSYINMITYEDLNRIYLEGEIMKVSFDVKEIEDVCSHVRSKEAESIIAFIDSNHKNMCFEYETIKEAEAKRSTIYHFILRRNLGCYINLFKRGNKIYVVKNGEGV